MRNPPRSQDDPARWHRGAIAVAYEDRRMRPLQHPPAGAPQPVKLRNLSVNRADCRADRRADPSLPYRDRPCR